MAQKPGNLLPAEVVMSSLSPIICPNKLLIRTGYNSSLCYSNCHCTEVHETLSGHANYVPRDR